MRGRRTRITVQFYNVPGVFKYPKNVPLPSKGDRVFVENNSGNVYKIEHLHGDRGTIINIYCDQ